MGWDIEFYRNRQGRKPVASAITKLPTALRAKLVRDIELLAEFGPSIGEPYVKKIAGTSVDLWELRTRRANNRVRTLFHVADKDRLILLHCFTKKTSRIPKKEIRTAERRLIDQMRRP